MDLRLRRGEGGRRWGACSSIISSSSISRGISCRVRVRVRVRSSSSCEVGQGEGEGIGRAGEGVRRRWPCARSRAEGRRRAVRRVLPHLRWAAHPGEG